MRVTEWSVVTGLVVVLVTLVQADVSRCPAGLSTSSATSRLVTRDNTCYQFVRDEKFWDQARDYCWKNGGKLVKLDDHSTNTFVLSALNSLSWTNKGVWIGLHDRNTELKWTWVTEEKDGAEKLTWSNWGKGHPKAFFHHHRDCVRMVRGHGDWKWHETPCHFMKWHYRFICQYEMRQAEPTQQPFPYIVGEHEANLGNKPPAPGGDTHVKLSTLPTTHVKLSTLSTIPHTSPLSTTEDLMTKYEDYDEDLSGVLVPLQLTQEEEVAPKRVAGGIVACVVAFIVALTILLVVLYRRRQHHKHLAELQDPTFCAHNMTYSSANNNVYNGCGQYGADGELDQCGPAAVKFAKAQNDYGVNLAGAKPSNHALATTVLAVRGKHYEEASSSLKSMAVSENDTNVKLEKTKQNKLKPRVSTPRAKQTLPRTPDDGYEVPNKSTNTYLPMHGSRENLLEQSQEPYMNAQMKGSLPSRKDTLPCDGSEKEHLYAEIPENPANIYQDLDDVQREIKNFRETEA